MTLTRAVNLTPSGPVGGGVLETARSLPDGWEQGVQFATEVCLIAGTHQFCPDSPGEKTFQGTDIAVFQPYGIELSVACTTLTSLDERVDKARAALRVVADYNIGQELATGTVSGNPSFADAVSAGSAASITEAVALLETTIASTLRGHLAYVHMSPANLVRAASADAVYRDLDGWRTPSGHVVVASAGYHDLIDLVATGIVYAGTGGIDPIRTIDRSDNRHLVVHEAAALAVFDPCFNVSVELTSP